MVLQGRRYLSENRRVDVSGQTGAAVLLHRQISVVVRRVFDAAGVCRSDDLWVEPAAGADLFDNARPSGPLRWRPRSLRFAGVMNGWSGVGPRSPSI